MDCYELELETWTDGGVNMFFYVDKNNIINEFREYAESFDIDEEIDVLREDRCYRDAFTLKESIADFEAYKNLLNDIAEELQGNVSKSLFNNSLKTPETWAKLKIIKIPVFLVNIMFLKSY